MRDPRHDRRRGLDERRRLRQRLRPGARARARRDRGGLRLADAGGAWTLVPALRACGTARWSSQAELRLRPRDPVEIKNEVRELNARRKAAQPTNRRTFGSVFKNPEHELTAGRMLEACGLKGHRIGGAQISPKHANFIENAGGARTADAIALMAEARRRAHEQYGVDLRHEVEFLGELELPPLG